jgi:cell wall-associated NlpC family hydrolase
VTDVLRVGVRVATVWASPDSPRELDAPAVADQPDDATWLAGLKPEDRLDLHGRTLTQLLEGEPVIVHEHREDWSQVIAPWQPVPGQDGYLGWVRTAHLRPARADDPDHPAAHVPPDRISVAAYAERFQGLTYLWGGTSPEGFDCSGLLHYCYRQAGIVVPRDSRDQALAATPVPLGEEEPGDVYFFAADDGRIYHVGFVAARGRMLHAPERDGSGQVVDEPLDDERRAHLVAAGRFEISPDTTDLDDYADFQK